MKIFVATILLLISFYIVKVDLIEGTIPLAYSIQPVECDRKLDYITVEIVAGDSLQSLFSLYPSVESISFTERLADFYNLNPHFINQSFKIGEKVLLPTYTTSKECK
ncbi:hypothetical protein SAMN05518871_102399 [Psychrobacillus sp. OK028]|uniref:hypothetical protein n=1 Tax=Psychrobacillus sp. OK028 TaxID=1884359 RepID=UPI0008849AB8|nr:hypothetical protein [Psychrobacillus sp. OK028]SDM85389.1 hypothetical protein SAMN05518871_102399 [Psychrobacillus sp. OK028]